VSRRARGQTGRVESYLDKVRVQLNGLGSIGDGISICLESNVSLVGDESVGQKYWVGCRVDANLGSVGVE
jgi:hypothetical protein